MQFYIDSADTKEIKEAVKTGLIDGATTNPSLIAKSGRSREEVIKEICQLVEGPVSAEVLSTTEEEMYKEGKELAKIADNVVVKLPMSEDSLCVVKRFSAEGIGTNVTLVFSALQALLVAKAGGTLVSPFVGRLDDTGQNGMLLIDQIVQIYQNYQFTTKVLVASVRHPLHILDSALLAADVVTLPYGVIQKLAKHPLTDKGLDQFLKDAGVKQ